jgi:hypothetical protein
LKHFILAFFLVFAGRYVLLDLFRGFRSQSRGARKSLRYADAPIRIQVLGVLSLREQVEQHLFHDTETIEQKRTERLQKSTRAKQKHINGTSSAAPAGGTATERMEEQEEKKECNAEWCEQTSPTSAGSSAASGVRWS